MLRFLRRLADNRDAGSLANRYRQQRFERFREFVADVPRPVRVIDVGGRPDFWRKMSAVGTGSFEVTLVNIEPVADEMTHDGMRVVEGDARNLTKFADESFDVAFSNSVIEHVGALDDMARMAAEVRRVAGRYFVQTPCRTFPIEPHFQFPFFALLPEAARAWIVRHLAVGITGSRSPDKETALARVRRVRLLSRRQFESLFPGGTLERERAFGLTKSWMIRGRSTG
jgi:SAM-dependent methyltransferase